MNEEQLLLNAVLANPLDDAPRGVYADWLDDHGQSERAEFIRVQIRLAGMKAWCPADPERMKGECPCTWHTMKRHERELLKACWTPYFRSLFPNEVYGIEVETVVMKWKGIDAIPSRGFIESLAMTAADCLAHLDTIRESHPIRRVELTTHPDVMALYDFNGGDSPGNVIVRHEAILARRWPGIEFKLPRQYNLLQDARPRSEHV